DCHRLANGKLMLPLQAIAESVPLDEWHRKPHSAAGNPGIEYAKYVRMLEPCSKLDLALESLRPYRFGNIRMQNLERDVTVVPEIASKINRCESTLTELALDRIPSGQRVFEWLPIAEWSHAAILLQ